MIKDYEELLKEHEEREQLILKCAEYCLDYDMSIRDIAENLGIGKTTVHKYLTRYLKKLDYDLYVQCQNRLKRHVHFVLYNRDSDGRFSK